MEAKEATGLMHRENPGRCSGHCCKVVALPSPVDWIREGLGLAQPGDDKITVGIVTVDGEMRSQAAQMAAFEAGDTRRPLLGLLAEAPRRRDLGRRAGPGGRMCAVAQGWGLPKRLRPLLPQLQALGRRDRRLPDLQRAARSVSGLPLWVGMRGR